MEPQFPGRALAVKTARTTLNEPHSRFLKAVGRSINADVTAATSARASRDVEPLGIAPAACSHATGGSSIWV